MFTDNDFLGNLMSKVYLFVVLKFALLGRISEKVLQLVRTGRRAWVPLLKGSRLIGNSPRNQFQWWVIVWYTSNLSVKSAVAANSSLSREESLSTWESILLMKVLPKNAVSGETSPLHVSLFSPISYLNADLCWSMLQDTYHFSKKVSGLCSTLNVLWIHIIDPYCLKKA